MKHPATMTKEEWRKFYPIDSDMLDTDSPDYRMSVTYCRLKYDEYDPNVNPECDEVCDCIECPIYLESIESDNLRKEEHNGM